MDRISDIRKIMDMLQGEPNGLRDGPEMLNEGPIGAVKSMLHKREGSKQRQQVATDLMKQYHVWLGKMDRQGTMADVEAFLRQENFSDTELDKILGPAGPAQANEPEQQEPETAAQAAEPEEEPEQEEEPEAGEDNTYDAEQGRTVPDDLDQKIQPYADMKPADHGSDEEAEDEQEAPAEDGKEFHGVEKNYKDADGNWDHAKIQAQLEKLGAGAKFVLGNHRFSIQDKAGNDDVVDEPVAAESILESVLLEYGPRVGRGQLKDIFNKAAVAYIAKNGGRQASTQRAAGGSDADQDKPRGSAASGGGSKGGQGPYDIDVMWNILQQNHIGKAQVTKLMKKVAGASSVSPSLSDQDMAVLGILGFAFLKSGF